MSNSSRSTAVSTAPLGAPAARPPPGNGCGSKNRRVPKWILVCGNMDQNLRNPACLILSHTQMERAKPQLREARGSKAAFEPTTKDFPKTSCRESWHRNASGGALGLGGFRCEARRAWRTLKLPAPMPRRGYSARAGALQQAWIY